MNLHQTVACNNLEKVNCYCILYHRRQRFGDYIPTSFFGGIPGVC